MTEPLAYLNGRFLPQSQARLTLHDAGFVLAATVTDLVRTFRHRLYRLGDHLARFRASCDRAYVPQPLPDTELAALADHLLVHNAALLDPDDDLALVFFATPGPVGYYLGEPGGAGDGPPTLGIHTFPIPFARYRTLFTAGARLVVPDVHALPPSCVDPRIKCRSRLHWWLADRQARQQSPGALALLADADGHLTETAGANFLIVRAGTVLTPPRDRVLGGVSLGFVEELCAELRVPFREQPLTLEEACAADEALLSSTTFCVAGVSSIQGRPIAWPGPILAGLLAAWSQRVGMDVAGQFSAAR